MWRETNLFGIYMSPLAVYMAAALVLHLVLRLVLVRLHVLRWVWNPPLAEAGMYVCILGGLVVFL